MKIYLTANGKLRKKNKRHEEYKALVTEMGFECIFPSTFVPLYRNKSQNQSKIAWPSWQSLLSNVTFMAARELRPFFSFSEMVSKEKIYIIYCMLLWSEESSRLCVASNLTIDLRNMSVSTHVKGGRSYDLFIHAGKKAV